MPDNYWDRLNLLDILLAFPAFCVGLGVTHSLLSEIPIERHAALIHFIVGLILGCNFWGILILLPPFLFRRRRELPSLGEWLWLAPGTNWLFLLAAAPWLSVVAYIAYIVISAYLAFLASLVLAVRIIECSVGRRSRWTDLFGSLNCLASSAMVICLEVAYPLRV